MAFVDPDQAPQTSATPKFVDPDAKEAAPTWSEVPGQALRNTPESAVGVAKGLYRAVRHPIETVKGLTDVAVGELRQGRPAGEPDTYAQKHPEAAARVDQAAKAFNDFYRQRYGSGEGFRKALATDPVGVVADLSAALGIGAEASGSEALSRAATVTNPLSAVKAAGPVAKAAGWLGKKYVGMRTGVGAEAVSEAVEAGRTGNKAFQRNMRGQADLTDVLKDADANLQSMMKAKNAEYKARMEKLQEDKTVDPFAIHNIRTAVQQEKDNLRFAGLKKNERASAELAKVNKVVERWRGWRDPDALTPLGLDAMKQRVGGILEGIPYEQKTARRAVQQVYDSIRKEIIRVAPDYAETMEQYSQASEQIRDIQQALSLPTGRGTGFSKDVALRKLQSVMRNNVQANYGERLALARALEQAGGRPILPALAGQAMSSWEPRGINRLVASGELGALAATHLSHPWLLGDVAAQSPRLMGEAAYAAGQIAPTVQGAYRSATSNEALLRALLLGKAGGLPEPDETGAVR